MNFGRLAGKKIWPFVTLIFLSFSCVEPPSNSVKEAGAENSGGPNGVAGGSVEGSTDGPSKDEKRKSTEKDSSDGILYGKPEYSLNIDESFSISPISLSQDVSIQKGCQITPSPSQGILFDKQTCRFHGSPSEDFQERRYTVYREGESKFFYTHIVLKSGHLDLEQNSSLPLNKEYHDNVVYHFNASSSCLMDILNDNGNSNAAHWFESSSKRGRNNDGDFFFETKIQDEISDQSLANHVQSEECLYDAYRASTLNIRDVSSESSDLVERNRQLNVQQGPIFEIEGGKLFRVYLSRSEWPESDQVDTALEVLKNNGEEVKLYRDEYLNFIKHPPIAFQINDEFSASSDRYIVLLLANNQKKISLNTVNLRHNEIEHYWDANLKQKLSLKDWWDLLYHSREDFIVSKSQHLSQIFHSTPLVSTSPKDCMTQSGPGAQFWENFKWGDCFGDENSQGGGGNEDTSNDQGDQNANDESEDDSSDGQEDENANDGEGEPSNDQGDGENEGSGEGEEEDKNANDGEGEPSNDQGDGENEGSDESEEDSNNSLGEVLNEQTDLNIEAVSVYATWMDTESSKMLSYTITDNPTPESIFAKVESYECRPCSDLADGCNTEVVQSHNMTLIFNGAKSPLVDEADFLLTEEAFPKSSPQLFELQGSFIDDLPTGLMVSYSSGSGEGFSVASDAAGEVDFVQSPASVGDNFEADIDLEFSSGKFYRATIKGKVYQFPDNPTPPTCNDGEYLHANFEEDE